MKSKEIVGFQIGDVIFRIVSELPFQMPMGSSGVFRCQQIDDAQYTYLFTEIQDVLQFTGKTKLIEHNALGFELYNEKAKYFRAFSFGDGYYDTVLHMGEKNGTVVYTNPSLVAHRCDCGFDIVNYLALEQLFLRFGGLFLHSSHVRVGEKALLFSAPSGTGKSTQADLWAKYAGAEIINGDRSLLRKKDGVWHAYGCPMCGTSGIHKQGNEPIHAIVMLSQGTENSVRRLTPGEAFQRMYPEITVPKWNRELVLRAMELLDDVMAHVPIYAFSCTKDESAVTALREAIGLQKEVARGRN